MTNEEFFEMFPDARGGNWEYQPETAECAYPVFVDGEDGWYMVYYDYGFRVENGVVEYDLWRCWDGDWDITYSGPISEFDADAKQLQDDSERSIRAYSQYVCDTGTDPLSEFHVATELVEQTRLTFVIESDADGIAHLVMPPVNNLPKEARTYLTVDASGILDITYSELLDALRDSNRQEQTYTVRDSNVVVTDIINVKIPNPDYVTELRALAAKHIGAS